VWYRRPDAEPVRRVSTSNRAGHVADYAAIYDPDTDFDAWLSRFVGRRIAERLGPDDTLLEIGCSTGVMTQYLAPRCRSVFAIDRSDEYLARFRARGFANAEAIVADAEEWSDPRRFDHVVATGLLGNLRDPERFIARCRDFLSPGGRFHLSVNNPRSLHRLAAVEMGLIQDVLDASALNHSLGNRNYDADQVLEMAKAAGLSCAHREGVFVKPLTNAMLAGLPDEVIEGLDRISHHVPDLCAVNYFVLVAI